MKRSAPLKRTPLKRGTKPLARSTKPIVKKRKGKPRRGRGAEPKYLNWIRALPCVVCHGLQNIRRVLSGAAFDVDRFVSEAAHIGARGLGQKCPDRQSVPMCEHCHRTGYYAHHAMGRKFWKHHGLDPKAIIAALNKLYDGEK